jgi:nucleotide-binding universal stress UspA family protein
MWDMEPPKILVAVEHVGTDAALAYAVHDATRRGCGVHLVHVAGPALWAACAYDDVVLLEDELRHSGEVILASAVQRAERLLDQVAPDDERLSARSWPPSTG